MRIKRSCERETLKQAKGRWANKEKVIKNNTMILIGILFSVVSLGSPAYANLYSKITDHIIKETPKVWEISNDDIHVDGDILYVPYKGLFKVCKEEGVIILGFIFSKKQIEFYNQRFSQSYYSNKRKPIGVEMEIIDHSKMFNRNDLFLIDTNIANELTYIDNYQADPDFYNYTLAINNPGELKPGKFYFAVFNFTQYSDQYSGEFELQIQLTGDMRSLKEEFPGRFLEYSFESSFLLFGWFDTFGKKNTDANNYFNIWLGETKLFKKEFFQEYDRITWNYGDEEADFEPNYCGFGGDPWGKKGGDSALGDSSGTGGSGSGYGGGGGNSGNGGGNGNPPDPYDPWEGYKNAVGIDSVRGSEEGEDDWEYVIEVPLGNIYDMDFRVKLKRKGGVWPDEVEASFYLSEDDIFDSGDVFLGSEDKDLSDEAEKKRSVYVDDVDMADFINEPGEYYVYVAVAYGTGTNRSTSRDKKERVKIIVTNETPISDGTFIWSPDGPVPGMTCTQWKEPADPHSWGDNFLCTTRSEDIRWSADGPIAGMRCTQIYESRDPHFNNNYLCVPNESALNFVWSESGNMSDMYCVRTDEPKDKHSWDDNYLCWSDSGANGAGLSGIYYGAYDTVTSNTGATSPDVLPASVHLNDASGNVRAIYTPAEVPTLPGITARIENIGALPSSAEQKHKLKTSVYLTGPGYESGWKFTNKQTKISGFGTPGYEENISFALPSDAVLNEGLYSIVVSTDETDKLTESNELNNTSPQVRFWVQNALPDIAVQALSVDDDLTEVEAGSKYDITIDVGNIAPMGGDARFPVVVQLWYDGDQLLGEQVIEAADLIAGGSTEVTVSGWTVPFEEGAHTLTATATNKYVPYEANLSNNTLAQNITIIVTPGDPNCVILNPMEDLPETGSFDLATTFIEFPDTVTQGDELHPKAQMCGVSGSSPRTRAMWAYARCDGTGFTHFDGDTDGGKDTGECVVEENIKGDDLATMDPGMYVIYFIANGVTLIPESDYSNNVQAKAFLLLEE